MPQFHVKRAYNLPDRQSFVLVGRVTEGEVRVGMLIDFTHGVSHPMGPIHCIESLKNEASHDTCLLFKYETEDERSLWHLLSIQNELVRVFESHEIAGID